MKLNLNKKLPVVKLGDIIKDEQGKCFLTCYDNESEQYRLMKMPECELLMKGEDSIEELMQKYFAPEELPTNKIYATERLEIIYNNRD